MATAALALVAAVIGASSSAGAAPEDIPWWERPVTVGTGFRTGSGGTSAGDALVSGTGRWVAFTSTAPDLLPDGGGSGAFLRDRWTDTTVRLGSDTVRRMRPTVMSQDGHLVGGVSSWPDGRIGPSWIWDQQARRLVDLPSIDDRDPLEPIGVNNDGYLIVRDAGSADARPRLMRSARIRPDGTITPFGVTARGSREFVAVTPSLAVAVAVVPRPDGTHDVVRIDLTTGAMVAASSTPGATGTPATNRSVAVSSDGRRVAMSWRLPEHRAVRVWDTVGNSFVDHVVPDGYDSRDVVLRAVLDDGRIVYDTAANVVLFADPVVHPERPVRVLNARFDDRAPAPITFDEFRRPASSVADDIDRVVICTSTPMSTFAPTYQAHCSLVPFPPSPLAAG